MCQGVKLYENRQASTISVANKRITGIFLPLYLLGNAVYSLSLCLHYLLLKLETICRTFGEFSRFSFKPILLVQQLVTQVVERFIF